MLTGVQGEHLAQHWKYIVPSQGLNKVTGLEVLRVRCVSFYFSGYVVDGLWMLVRGNNVNHFPDVFNRLRVTRILCFEEQL